LLQLISVLKSLVENAQMPPDEALSTDLGSILHVLVQFISRFSDPVSYRIRVKFCALCESICERTDTLNVRKDDLSRNCIVDVVMDWFQDPLTVCPCSSRSRVVAHISQNNDPEAIQFQYELNIASLRTVVRLLERLKLQPIDNKPSDGDDSGHAVSRLFIRYSHVLLRALDICRPETLVSIDYGVDLGAILITLKASDSSSDVPSLQKVSFTMFGLFIGS
jgi:hypothetical protein